MGGASTKVTSAGPQVKKTTNALKDVVSTAATSAKRKIQKEGRQYMAPERAQKELEKQKAVPKRAPMNIGKATIPEDSRKAVLKKVKDMQARDKDYLSMMKDIFVTSKDPEDHKNVPIEEHSSKRSLQLEQKLPKIKERSGFEALEKSDIPRGRTELRLLIEALYNHKMSPKDWGPTEIAERLRLRESDTVDLLKHFELLDKTTIFRSKLPYDSK